MLILGKTQWEDVDVVKVIMDLSSWRRHLGKSLFTICTASRGAEVKAAGDKTLTGGNILQHVWMLSLWLQKVPQPSSWNKI